MLGFRMNDSLPVGSPFPKALWISWTYSLLVFKPNILIVPLSGAEPKGWVVPNVGTNPLLFREKFCIFEISPTCGLPCLEWNFWQELVSVSPTHLDIAFLSFVVEALFIWFSGLF